MSEYNIYLYVYSLLKQFIKNDEFAAGAILDTLYCLCRQPDSEEMQKKDIRNTDDGWLCK